MAARTGQVVAYHPGIDQAVTVDESAMGQMRASGWVTMEEHLEMQDHLARQGEATKGLTRGPDAPAAADKAASGKEK